jgi:hypothetical protein
MRTWNHFFATLAMLTLLAGCDSGPPDNSVPLTGKLLMNGQPLHVTGQEVQLGQVTLELHPIEAGTEDVRTTAVEQDGSFDFAIDYRRGVEPGRYQVVVYQFDPYPEDKLQGRFSPEKSKLELVVTEDQQPVTLELADAPQ